MTNETPHHATICYLEIPAPNIEAAGKFYSAVFGWKITPSNLSDKPYWMYSTGAGNLPGNLDGGLDPERKVSADSGTIIYVKIKDIDETIAKAKKIGGSIVRDKFNIGGGHGFSAIVQNPNGNQVGLLFMR